MVRLAEVISMVNSKDLSASLDTTVKEIKNKIQYAKSGNQLKNDLTKDDLKTKEESLIKQIHDRKTIIRSIARELIHCQALLKVKDKALQKADRLIAKAEQVEAKMRQNGLYGRTEKGSYLDLKRKELKDPNKTIQDEIMQIDFDNTDSDKLALEIKSILADRLSNKVTSVGELNLEKKNREDFKNIIEAIVNKIGIGSQ